MKRRPLFSSLLGSALLLFGTNRVEAAVFNIANGDITALKTAINSANANGEDDTIELAANGTYTLTVPENALDGLPVIDFDGGKKLTIHGNGATIQRTAADGTPFFRIFHIIAGNMSISALTMSNGNIHNIENFTGNYGGAIYNDHGVLTLSHCVLAGNTADYAGGIYNDGASTDGASSGHAILTISDSTISGSYAADVSGIWNTGEDSGNATVTLNNCILSGNVSDESGAIYNDGHAGSAALTVNNSTLVGNSGGDGVAIGNNAVMGAATAIVSNSTLSTNSGWGYGGGIYNTCYRGTGTVTVSNSTLSGNSANVGGAIMVYAPRGNSLVTVSNSTLRGNSATSSGGAIANTIVEDWGSAIVTVENSTVSGNSAPFGGGILNTANDVGISAVTLTNCTVSDNSASASGGYGGFGGGFFNGRSFYSDPSFSGSASLHVINSTLSNNSADSGGGIYNNAYPSNNNVTVEIANSLLKAGAIGENIHNNLGTVTSHGHNLTSDDGSGFLTAAGDQTNTPPQLDPAGLQDNGGPTQTIALLPNSPAIDAGNDANAPSTDQRGYLRPNVSDIGAFEFQGIALRVLAVAPSGTNIAVTFAAVANKTFRLERKLAMSDAEWQSILGVDDVTPANNGPAQIADPGAVNLGRAFYRVRLVTAGTGSESRATISKKVSTKPARGTR